MLITDQVATAPCTDPIQVRFFLLLRQSSAPLKDRLAVHLAHLPHNVRPQPSVSHFRRRGNPYPPAKIRILHKLQDRVAERLGILGPTKDACASVVQYL